jgi:hypothetical protein
MYIRPQPAADQKTFHFFHFTNFSNIMNHDAAPLQFIPTRRRGILDIGQQITFFVNKEYVSDDDNGIAHNRWEIWRDNVRYVSCMPDSQESEMYRVLSIQFIDAQKHATFDCSIVIPNEWTARTFLVFLMSSIERRNPKIISIVMQQQRQEHDDVHNVDINNILSGYHPLAMDAQLDLQYCSEYNSMVRGGDYV